MMKFLSLILILALYFSGTVNGQYVISPDNERIEPGGAFFIIRTPEKLILNRHLPEIINMPETEAAPRNAFAQSGVSISFITDSKHIKVLMEPRLESSLRYAIFGIYKNGKLVNEIKVLPKNTEIFDGISFENPEGELAQWKVLFPTYYGVDIKGIQLDEDSKFKTPEKDERPVYVAIGNSITQGTGQAASFQTYPYILADKKGWQLYNMAVGGSKISWPFALEIKNKKVDVITILWGFNDWNKGYTPKGEIIPRYTKLLKMLADDHPEAKIYCITPTYTYATKPKNGNVSLDEIREAEKKAAMKLKDKGYKNIFIINGPDISGPENLKPQGSKDKVHFTVEGAAKFAESLSDAISKIAD
ncbi:MAG: SGNH/GDSL hydrolase family protein [Chlorobi bacterium]|nr:SGNH/GDSL hydrolase family protein [Chlorobiota bacterium]